MGVASTRTGSTELYSITRVYESLKRTSKDSGDCGELFMGADNLSELLLSAVKPW